MNSTTSIAVLFSIFAMALGVAIPDVDTATAPSTVDNSAMACTQDDIKCAGGNPGGAVFQCKNGAWVVISACRPYENCVSSPRPHCTWARQNGMMDSDFNVFDVEPELLSNSN